MKLLHIEDDSWGFTCSQKTPDADLGTNPRPSMLPVVDISPDAHATTSYIQPTRFHLHLKQYWIYPQKPHPPLCISIQDLKSVLQVEDKNTKYCIQACSSGTPQWHLACNKFNKHPPCSSSLSESHINAYSGGSKASDYIHKVKVVIIIICKCQHPPTSKTSPDLQHAETYNLPSYMWQIEYSHNIPMVKLAFNRVQLCGH
jgi:hypothetical protein